VRVQPLRAEHAPQLVRQRGGHLLQRTRMKSQRQRKSVPPESHGRLRSPLARSALPRDKY
jgi:hypothetical protein